MIDVLAFPNIVPWQVALAVGVVLHVVVVASLVVRRGHPSWLGLALGFVPLLGPALALMLPVDPEAAKADRTPSATLAGSQPMLASGTTVLLLLLAVLVPVVRLFLRASGQSDVLATVVDDNLGLWIILIVGLAAALIIGAISRTLRVQVIVARATLILAIAWVGLLLVERNVVRVDMTAEQRYSLDPATRHILEDLPRRPEVLSITYYYSPRSLRPHRLTGAPEEIGFLLEEYRRVAPDHIRIQMVEVPQKLSGAEAEDDAASVFGRSREERERRKADQSESARRRTELLELLERRSIEPITETTREGGKSVGFSYYSSFWISYGQQPGDRINGLTVTREEADAGHRVVDRAQYELTNMIRRLVRASFHASQPFAIEYFSTDGSKVKFVDDDEYRPVGYAGLVDETGVKWTITEIDASAEQVRLVQSGIDEEVQPAPEVNLDEPESATIHYIGPVTHQVGFLSGHDEPANQYQELRTRINRTGRFEWEYVDLQGGRVPVPDHIDVLVIGAVAGELTLREQYEIDQYLMRGGRLLAFNGPLTWTGGGGGMMGAEQFPAVHPSWGEFLARYHVSVGRQLIFDEQCLIWSTDRNDGRPVEVPPILHMRSYPSHPVNAGLVLESEQGPESTYMIYPATVDVNREALPQENDEPRVEVRDVLLSSPRAWLHGIPRGFHREPFAWTNSLSSGYTEAMRAFRSAPETDEGFSQFSLGISLEGRLDSGFTPETIPPRPREVESAPPPGFPPGFNPRGAGGDGDGLQDPGDGAEGAEDAEDAEDADDDGDSEDAGPGAELAPADDTPQTRPGTGDDGADADTGDTDTGDETPQTAPQTGPGETVEPDTSDHLATAERESRVLVFGQSFAYPVHIPFGANYQLYINSLDWLVGNDDLLSLARRSSARRPIDPSLSPGTRNWFGWMVFLVVPLALVLVSFFVFVFGIQERWFLKARQQAGGNAATATSGTTSGSGIDYGRDREPGLAALVIGLVLVGVLIVGWANVGGFAGLWVAGLLLAGALVARGVQILFEN